MKKKTEYNIWHNSCEFIEKNLKYYSFTDFLTYHKQIKKTFKEQDLITKRLYQWYVFSSNVSYIQKCGIWDYLNDYLEYNYLVELKSNKDLKELQNKEQMYRTKNTIRTSEQRKHYRTKKNIQ